MKIDFSCNDEKTEKFLKKPLISTIKEILKDPVFKDVPKNSYLSITIIDNKEIKELNKTYRNIDKSTDVLSFSYSEILPNEFILGEIILSLEMMIENAREYGLSIGEEILQLIIHGMLHLIGYDHETKEEEKEMKYHEKRLMKLFKGKTKLLEFNKELQN
jgi:probable rRNA maturation factor